MERILSDGEERPANDLWIIAVLADSRGLDTYYLNSQYPEGYGIDRVFATQLSRKFLQAGTSPAFDAVLLPDHFRAGTLESKILRLALNNPAAVILCDGIWETLLNREKHFQRAEELGRLPRGLYGDESEFIRETAGTVLTELFLNGDLDVSPAAYTEHLNRIVGYFARRRRRVYWLSLPVPPPDHRGGVHYAGNYRPLSGWDRCMNAINDAAGKALSAWGQSVVRLEPLIEQMGGADKALLDLWHFTPAFHERLAGHLADRLVNDLAEAPARGRHPSFDAMIPGRTQGRSILTLNRDVANEQVEELRDSALMIPEPDEIARDEISRDLMSRCHSSVIALYPEEV